MFDDVLGMAALYTESFRNTVHDSFGMSITTDVLEPILKEIDSLRIFNEEFERQVLDIDSALENTRLIQGQNHGHER